ncbi:MAG: aminodeoxychorismate synthase component I [Nitriliruptorales bacterium]|nr:aminodeoxychorismate synthase component I [Nitriliruptorales bacterium]
MPARIGAVAPERILVTHLDHTPDLLGLSGDPRLTRPAVVSVRGWQLLVADPVARLRSLAALDSYAAAVGWRDEPTDGPPFRTGAVGCLNDDLSAGLLGLPPDARPAVAPVGQVDFGVYEWAIAIDPDGRGWVVAERDQTAALRSWIASAPRAGIPSRPPPRNARLGLARRDHGSAVARILEWIAAGDLYQANLTLQVAVSWTASAQLLAARLWQATPGASHAAMMVLDRRTAVVSASPETFLRTHGDLVVTRPVKGTRRREEDPVLDERRADELRGSDKDHAEHVMIVDLERNDLGRACEPGSVRVADYAALEAHPTVWHLTSTVRGRMRNDVGLAALVAATFPSGSVTGTPKRMAVARTALLEPVRRGVYCGAMGVVAPGMVDLSVAIRTAVVHQGMASYGTGGGIVADSDPDQEFAEAMDKAAAFYTATGASPP